MLEPPVTHVCQTLQLLRVTMFEVDQVNQQETFQHFLHSKGALSRRELFEMCLGSSETARKTTFPKLTLFVMMKCTRFCDAQRDKRSTLAFL